MIKTFLINSTAFVIMNIPETFLFPTLHFFCFLITFKSPPIILSNLSFLQTSIIFKIINQSKSSKQIILIFLKNNVQPSFPQHLFNEAEEWENQSISDYFKDPSCIKPVSW